MHKDVDAPLFDRWRQTLHCLVTVGREGFPVILHIQTRPPTRDPGYKRAGGAGRRTRTVSIEPSSHLPLAFYSLGTFALFVLIASVVYLQQLRLEIWHLAQLRSRLPLEPWVTAM